MAVTPEELLHDGRLDEALVALQERVRKDAANPKLRTFLFQLLAVRGEWERALTQLNVAADLDPASLAMAQTYREALACEAFRTSVFAGERSPVVLGNPAQWTAELLDALRLAGQGEFAASQSLRDRAFAAAPAVSGSLNGERFEWIADADPRLGPMIEVVLNGRYCWVPFANVSEIRLEPFGTNGLRGTGKVGSDPRLRVAVTLTLAGGKPQQERFEPFARPAARK